MLTNDLDEIYFSAQLNAAVRVNDRFENNEVLVDIVSGRTYAVFEAKHSNGKIDFLFSESSNSSDEASSLIRAALPKAEKAKQSKPSPLGVNRRRK